MNKTLIFLLSIIFAANAFGGFINANDLKTGENITNSFGSSAILHWVSKEQNKQAIMSPLIVNQANTEFLGNYSQYFGSVNGKSDTYGLGNLQDTLNDPANYPEENAIYSAIAITFTQPVLSFGFEAENFNGDEQFAFLFTPQGSLIRRETIIPLGITGDFGAPISGYKHTFDLTSQNVGSIILGSWSSATYYYKLSIDTKLPEPSSILMLVLGLTLLRIKQIKTVSLRCITP